MSEQRHPRAYVAQFLEALERVDLAISVVALHGGNMTRWYANEAAARMVGVSREEMMSWPVMYQFAEDEQPRIKQMIAAAARDELRQGVIDSVIQHADGRYIPIEMRFCIMDIDQFKVSFVFVRDISDRQRMQLRILEDDRRELIANIASGLAHEVFNPLTYVQLNICRLQRALAGSGEHAELLQHVDHGLTRVIDTVQKVGELTGISPVEAKTCCLVRVVETAVSLLRPNILARAEVELHLPPAPLEIVGDPASVGQAVFNALLFAAGGHERSTGAEHIRVSLCVEETGYLRLQVADDGASMSQTDLVRVLAPFMQTERAAGSTSLSVARALVEALGGYVSVAAAEPHGVVTSLAFRRA